MKQIKLTKGKFALVDDEDFEYLNKFKWNAEKSRGRFYASRSAYINNKKKNIRMHVNLINPENGKIVDHIDNNGLNNQRYNLRECTHSQNNTNKFINKNGRTSRFIGVCLGKNKYKKWRAVIKKDKKQISLGTYETELEAAIAYNEGAIKYHGEFARLNEVK